MDSIAEEVVIERKPTFRFDVDGAEFPWYISERGSLVSRVMDDLYVVDVQVILLDRETHEWLSFGYTNQNQITGSSSVPYIPIIGGVEFPWLLTDDTVTLTFSHKEFPLLSLKFFAHNVIAEYIEDNRDIFCAGGHLIGSRKEEEVV